MITREEFVKICTDAIHQTRTNVTPANQVSGYFKYHKEIKENKYINRYSYKMLDNIKENGYSFAEQHAFIEYAGVGYCQELAEHLSVEIITRLKEKQADAGIFLVVSRKVDHAYLHINLSLKDEKYPSLWEVDAWDPRIIDRSYRPNGTIKNQEILRYGTDVRVQRMICASDPLIRFHDTFTHLIEKPIPGQLPNQTPRREVLRKYRHLLYADYSLERSYANGTLNAAGKIDYSQGRSIWQSTANSQHAGFHLFYEPSKKRKSNEEHSTNQAEQEQRSTRRRRDN